jgi:hypothetical protein
MTFLMGCLSNDGAFWRLGADSSAERFVGSGRWVKEDNAKLVELSVGSAVNAWGVDSSGALFQLTYSPMTQVPAPPAREVAVSSDDDLWIMNWGDSNQPYRRNAQGGWDIVRCTPYPWKITCGDPGDVWVLAESWFWGYARQYNGSGWTQRGDQVAFAIAVGNDGAAFTNAGGETEPDIYQYVPSGGPWRKIPAPTDYAIACVAGNEDWVVGGDAWQRSGADWNYYPAPAGVQFDGVAAASDGTILAWQGEWSQKGQAYRFNGTGGWDPLPLAPPKGFFNAAAAHAHNCYFVLWDNHTLLHWPGSTWVSAGRSVKKVAACADGSLWTIDAGGTAARRAADGTWQAFSDQLIHIGGGGHDVAWGVDPSGAARKWDGMAFQPISSDLGQSLLDISVGADGTVCAIGADESLLYLAGANWKVLQPGQAFLRVEVADASRICAVSAIDRQSGTNFVWIGGLPATPNTRAGTKAAAAKAPPKPRRRKHKEPKGKLRHWFAQNA